MPISLCPEIGFEVRPIKQSEYTLPIPKITQLSPDEIVQELLSGGTQKSGEISIIHPAWLIGKAIHSIKPLSPREALTQFRKVLASSALF